jgi:hypothetical protein
MKAEFVKYIRTVLGCALSCVVVLLLISKHVRWLASIGLALRGNKNKRMVVPLQLFF